MGLNLRGLFKPPSVISDVGKSAADEVYTNGNKGYAEYTLRQGNFDTLESWEITGGGVRWNDTTKKYESAGRKISPEIM